MPLSSKKKISELILISHFLIDIPSRLLLLTSFAQPSLSSYNNLTKDN